MSNVYSENLLSCRVIIASPDGTMDFSGDFSGEYIICGRLIESGEGLQRIGEGMVAPDVKNRIAAVDFSGCRVADLWMGQVLSGSVNKLPNLVELNLSYVSLGYKAVTALCSLLDMKISGYCNIQRLILVRTRLDPQSCKSIVSAATGSIQLKEINISGNKNMNSATASVLDLMSHPECRVESLGLGYGGFEREGISSLSPTFGAHLFLKYLTLSDNNFGDEGAEILFGHLENNSAIEMLCLDRCSLVSCRWASHICLMESLHTLKLACNDIDDGGLQELCRHLERAACLRHVVLANNNFGERAICLGSLIHANPGIISLDVSGNTLSVEAINAIAFGIGHNHSLADLVMINCNLLIENIGKLCLSLCVNPLIKLNITGNPIDIGIQHKPRDYGFHLKDQTSSFMQQTDAEQGESHFGFDRHPESDERGVIPFAGLETAESWRREKIASLKEDKLARSILAETLGAAKEHADALILDGPTSDERPQSVEGDRPNTAADPSKKKKSRFRRAKEEEEKTVITVCYGRRTEVLGTIEVPESASYEDVRKLVHPLVREYYGRLVQSTEDLDPQYKLTDGIDKTDAFFMTGPDGCPMSREAEQSRALLAELKGSALPTSIVIRPSTWMSLSGGNYNEQDD